MRTKEDIGRGERIRTSGPCLPKAVLSTVANVKSTTYAHRSRVYVTQMDRNGLLSVTLWSQWSPLLLAVTQTGRGGLNLHRARV